MMALLLSIDGAILINWLAPGEKLNSGDFCEKIFEPLSEILLGGRSVGSLRPMAHLDNAPLH
jgi:hypothetical protein